MPPNAQLVPCVIINVWLPALDGEENCPLAAFLVIQMVKNLPATCEAQVWPLGWEDNLEKEMATHSSVLAWKTPWTEKPGELQTMRSQSRIWLSNIFTLSATEAPCYLKAIWGRGIIPYGWELRLKFRPIGDRTTWTREFISPSWFLLPRGSRHLTTFIKTHWTW